MDSIAAQLLLMLSSDNDRRHLAEQKNEEAQALLNLFQELLDLMRLSPIRPQILTIMLVISKRTSLYPESLILQGVERQGGAPVAGGSFGDVWMGRMEGETVAIKVIRSLDPGTKRRTHEAVLWQQLRHPNVLAFYGLYTWERGPRSALCLVSPWADHGNIVDYLRKAPSTDRAPMLLDIACGLEYLHTFDPPVIHGDLKGTNILVTSSLKACIADFGLCTLAQHHEVRYTSSSSLGAGALLYRAPELLNRGQGERQHSSGNGQGEWMTVASDVYSFGCICYELFTGRPRFYNLGIFDAIMAVRENYFVEKPTTMNDALWELVQMCWQTDPTLRPTGSHIVNRLRLQLDFNEEPPNHTPERDDGTPSITPQVSSMASVASLYPDRNELTHLDEPSEVHISIHESTEAGPPSLIEEALEPLYDARQVNCRMESTSPDAASSLTTLLDDKAQTINKDDIIIAVMGSTGTGKSSFIKHAIPNCGVVVGHGVESCTIDVRAYSCSHPNSGRKVVLVDTPGFDDTERMDYEILENIAHWLKSAYEKDVTLSGILYLHSIADNRMKGKPRKNLEMFQHLCGNTALENVILTTTHWDRVSDNVASKREAELTSSFWKSFVDKGSRVARFYPSTFDGAWRIIDLFKDTPHRVLKLQKEMVNQGKELHETSASKFLVRWWKKLVKKLNGMMRKGQSVPSEREFQAMREQMTPEGNLSLRTIQPQIFSFRRHTISGLHGKA